MRSQSRGKNQEPPDLVRRKMKAKPFIKSCEGRKSGGTHFAQRRTAVLKCNRGLLCT